MRGIYILIIRIRKNICLEVGAKGKIGFRKGLFAYVGSAQNNLEKRIIRHFKRHKLKFWHIDYLLNDPHVEIATVFLRKGPKTQECAIAKIMCQKFEPTVGFGCSDCKCLSHLFHIESHRLLQNLSCIFFRKTYQA